MHIYKVFTINRQILKNKSALPVFSETKNVCFDKTFLALQKCLHFYNWIYYAKCQHRSPDEKRNILYLFLFKKYKFCQVPHVTRNGARISRTSCYFRAFHWRTFARAGMVTRRNGHASFLISCRFFSPTRVCLEYLKKILNRATLKIVVLIKQFL